MQPYDNAPKSNGNGRTEDLLHRHERQRLQSHLGTGLPAGYCREGGPGLALNRGLPEVPDRQLQPIRGRQELSREPRRKQLRAHSEGPAGPEHPEGPALPPEIQIGLELRLHPEDLRAAAGPEPGVVSLRRVGPAHREAVRLRPGPRDLRLFRAAAEGLAAGGLQADPGGERAGVVPRDLFGLVVRGQPAIVVQSQV
ncbi:Hypothetical_protein [Hexamita inflata]|uniref:Hypothetical_protein n=1 Tax=Hexamita inflata TaxID=28002 RepID=A0AA86P3H0_9EUKA|nr:Hypothetical protein HINF_LOCUS18568 [Hexamita inflata]